MKTMQFFLLLCLIMIFFCGCPVLGVDISGSKAQTPFLLPGGDFDGDGLDDICVFGPSDGAWYIRGVTAVSFGQGSDYPAVGDFDGDGTAEIALYRSTAGLWLVRGVTRRYFGSPEDI